MTRTPRWLKQLTPVLVALSLLLAATSAQAQTFNWYWYNGNNENCWQTGQLGSEGRSCDFVFANYLPGHMSEGGFNQDLKLPTNGDYCAYFGAGDELNTPIASSQGGATGYTTPSPFSSYQEGDANGSTCQANADHWGQEMRSGVPGGLCGPLNGEKSCGMEHYAVLNRGATADRPWSSLFREPSFVLSTNAGMQTFSTASNNEYGGWAFVCPEFEDTNFHGVIEDCLEEWRSPHNAPVWTGEHFQECGGGPYSEIVSMFYPGTQYSEEMPGSSNTLVGTGGTAHFEARITASDIANAARLINSHCAGWHLSENASEYALIGVEQGIEGWDGISEMAANEEGLNLSTQYTARPPVVSTSPASGVREEQATLNGTVNPEATDTHYHFEYGKTTAYGSSTPEVDAGPGTSGVPASATISGLSSFTTYHYRLVASNAGGTSRSADREFTTKMRPDETASSWALRDRATAKQFVYYRGSNGEIAARVFENGEWISGEHAGHPAAANTTPSVVRDPATGRIMVFYQGANNQIDVWNYENATGWVWGEHSGHAAAPGTSPSATYDPATGRIMVFYQGANNQIDAWNYENATNWTWGEHPGHAAAPSTSPTATYDPATGRIMVFYQGANNQIDAWNYENATNWTWGEHPGHAAAAGTSPTTDYDPATGRIMVFYQGSNNQIDAWNYENATNWTWGEHPGHAAAAGTSPSATYSPDTGRIMVFYQGSNNQIDAWNYENATNWTWGEHPGHAAAAGTSPTVLHEPETGGIWVYFRGAGGSINSWNYENAGGWAWGELK